MSAFLIPQILYLKSYIIKNNCISCKKSVPCANAIFILLNWCDNIEKIKREGIVSMKKLKNVVLKIVSDMALANAKKEANSTCIFLGYQPKVPEKLKKKNTQNKL